MSDNQDKNLYELAEEQLVRESITAAKSLIGGVVVAALIGMYNRREHLFSFFKK